MAGASFRIAGFLSVRQCLAGAGIAAVNISFRDTAAYKTIIIERAGITVVANGSHVFVFDGRAFTCFGNTAAGQGAICFAGAFNRIGDALSGLTTIAGSA